VVLRVCDMVLRFSKFDDGEGSTWPPMWRGEVVAAGFLARGSPKEVDLIRLILSDPLIT